MWKITTAVAADKAAADSVAMNSFIQELRHLSNSSAISSISSASTDSGISTSHYGDSNVGSGMASATSNSKHQQQHCIGVNNNNMHGKASPTTGAVPKVGGIPASLGLPTATTTIWGNKSLWGPAPFSPPLPETSALVSSSAIKSSPALPVAVTSSPTSNALYSSLSKELYSPWATPAATGAAASPIASLATQQQLSALNTNTSTTVLSKTTSIPTGNNNTGTNIWDSKLDLFGSQQQCPTSLLGSIWVTPELSTSETTFASHDEAHGPSASGGGTAAWGSNIMSHAVQTMSHGSTGGGGGDTMNAAAAAATTSKLSTLWSNAPSIGATGGVMSGAENGSVLKSLRMGMGGGGIMSSSDNVTSAEVVTGVSSVGRVGPSDNMGLLSSNTSPSTALFSDEVMSYLNVFN